MWAAIVALFELGVLVLREIFEAQKRAREAQEKYEVDTQKVLELFDGALLKMRQRAAAEHQQAIDVEDRVDEETKRDV